MKWNVNDHYQTLSKKIRHLGGHAFDSNDILLDLGCGEGKLTEVFNRNFSSKLVIGLDINYNNSWRKYENLNYVVSDANNLPFKDVSIDVLIEKDVLHHCSDPAQIVREIKRVTKTLAVIIEANRYHPVSFIHMTLIRKHDHLSKAQFLRLLRTVFYNKKSNFFQIESHVYPIDNVQLLKIIHILEEFISKIPVINRFLNYNIAVIRMSQ